MPDWRIGDKCIPCDTFFNNQNESALHEYKLAYWPLSPKCEMCNRLAIPLLTPPSPPPSPPCLLAGCDDVQPPSDWQQNTCELQLQNTVNCAARVAKTLNDGLCALTCGVCNRCPPSMPPPMPPPSPPPCTDYCVDVEPPSDWRLNKCALWRAELEANIPAGPLDPAVPEVGYCKHRYATNSKGSRTGVSSPRCSL